MSHIVQIQTEVRDPAAVRSACERLRLPMPMRGTFKLYSQSATGLGVQLTGWKYPVVCDTTAGTVAYDNYNGHWGPQQQLDGFLQMYSVEKTRIEARRRGHTVTEQPLPDGSIKLVVQVAG